GGQMFANFGILNSHLMWTREVFPTRAYQSLGNLSPGGGGGGARAGGGEHPGEQRPVPDGICIGDPDRILQAVKVWDSMGIDGINFLLNAAEMVPQEQVLASMRLFAKEVMPKC